MIKTRKQYDREAPTCVEKIINDMDKHNPEEDILIFGDDKIKDKTGIDFVGKYNGLVPVDANHVVMMDKPNKRIVKINMVKSF